MTATAHALVAGAIAARFSDPISAALLAVGSHFIMDSIPHWDFGTNWRNRPKHKTGLLAIAETIFGITTSYIFFGQQLAFPLWACTVFFSIVPDWLETPWYIFYANAKKLSPAPHASILEKISFAFYKIPNIFHAKAQLPFGIVTQVMTVIFFLVMLAR